MSSKVYTNTNTNTNTNAAQDQAVVLAEGASLFAETDSHAVTAEGNGIALAQGATLGLSTSTTNNVVDSRGVEAAFRFATEVANRSSEGVEHLIGAVEEMAEMSAGAMQESSIANAEALMGVSAAYQNASTPAVDIEKITPWIIAGFFAVGLAAWGMNRGKK